MRPQDVLPDDINQVTIGDVQVRKGSVGAFIANALVVCDPQAPEAARVEAERHLRELVPALTALRLFEVFELRDSRLRALVGG
jgi:uncharacterized protein